MRARVCVTHLCVSALRVSICVCACLCVCMCLCLSTKQEDFFGRVLRSFTCCTGAPAKNAQKSRNNFCQMLTLWMVLQAEGAKKGTVCGGGGGRRCEEVVEFRLQANLCDLCCYVLTLLCNASSSKCRVFFTGPMAVSASVCLFLSLPACLRVCLSVCLSIFLSFSLSFRLSFCLYVCLFLSLSVRLYVCLSLCLFVFLSVRLSVCSSPCQLLCVYISLSVCLCV